MREKFYSKHGMLVTLAVMLLTLFGGNVNAQTLKSLVMQNEGGTEKIDLLAAESVEKLIANYNIVVTLEDDANVNYLILKLGEGDTYMKTWSSVAKGDDGKFTFWIPLDYELASGVDYPVIITGYETNPDAAGDVPSNFTSTDQVIKGGTKQYEYSSVTLVDPDPNTIVTSESQFALADPSQNTISFTYSGPVQNVKSTIPRGMGDGTVDCGVALSEDEKTVTVTIPESILSTYHQFTLNVYAYGKDNGGAVKGNSGEKEASAYQVNVDVDFNLPTANIAWPSETAKPSFVNALKFAYTDGILDAYTGKTITITDGVGNVVATSTEIESVIPFAQRDNYNYLVNEVIVSLDNVITTPGTYTVNVPKGVFNLDQTGDGFTSKPCKAETYTFTVAAPTTNVPETISTISDPAQGPVSALDGFTFTFNGVDNIAWTGAFAPTISLEKYGWTYTYAMPLYTPGQGNNLLRAALLDEGSFTEPGNYTITIPAGAVYFNNDEANVNTEPFYFKYEIEAPVVQTYTVNPAEGVVESLKTISVTFDGQEIIGWGNGNPVITDADNNEYKVDCSYGTADNEGIFTLKEEITTPGTYTLTIPAGAVVYGEYGDSSNEEDITFTWTIEAPKAEFEVTPANGSTVESLSNITVTFNKISEENGVDFDFVTKQPTFTLPSGEVVNLGNTNISYGYPYNIMTVNLGNEYTATGIYKLFLPAGFVFEYTNNSNVVDKDLTFEWGVGCATEIQAMFAKEKNVEIYNAAGVLVKRGDASVIKTLEPNKMYIINGKKVIIRK